ncbi:MAG: SDR family oxidoreductase, partial [Proteobacteria bacterium]|nr:SDR family oxidoreductase [Pseudomonadota bacterium]
RVNGVSAGPLKTLASSALGVSKMMEYTKQTSPLSSSLRAKNVAETSAFLLSDLAAAITGEIIHVDCGYHAMGAQVPI